MRLRTSLVMAIALVGSLAIVAQPAQAHCAGDNGLDENLSGLNGAGGRPSGMLFETYGRNMVKRSHCYNDNFHYVWYWDGGWQLANAKYCARWTYPDWTPNGAGLYQCWLYWNVTPGFWWTATADFVSVSNHWAQVEGGFKADHRWDYDWASASDCWFYHGGVLWTRDCT